MKDFTNNHQNPYGRYGFFKHPVGALLNNDISMMAEDQGAKGIGVFWCILEFLCAMPYQRAYEKSILNNLRRVRANSSYVLTILHDYGLFEFTEDGMVRCPLLEEYTQPYNDTAYPHARARGKKVAAAVAAPRAAAVAAPETVAVAAPRAAAVAAPRAVAVPAPRAVAVAASETVAVAVPETVAVPASRVAPVPAPRAASSTSNTLFSASERSVKITKSNVNQLLNENISEEINQKSVMICQQNLLSGEAELIEATEAIKTVENRVEALKEEEILSVEDLSEVSFDVNKNENDSPALYIENKKENKENNFKKINNKKILQCTAEQNEWKYWEDCIDDMAKDQAWIDLVGMHSGLKGDFHRLFPVMIQHFRNHIRMYHKEAQVCSDNDARTYFARCYRDDSYVMKCFLRDIASIPAYGQVGTKEDDPYRYETVDPVTGARSYNGTPIPADAPPRPSNLASWHIALKKWR